MPARDDEVYRITSAMPGRSVDRDYRTRRYLISMGIRTVCFLGAVFVPGGPAKWVLIFLALVLPYFSVILANNASIEERHDIMPPLILKDTAELPVGHPDRTAA